MSAYGADGGPRCHQYERRLELNQEDLPHCPFPRQQLKADAEGLWRFSTPSSHVRSNVVRGRWQRQR